MNGLGETEALTTEVENSVVGADEHITQDPKGAWGRGDVNAHESGKALSLASRRDLQDVVLGGEGVDDLVDHNLDVGQGVDDIAGCEDTLSVHNGCSKLKTTFRYK